MRACLWLVHDVREEIKTKTELPRRLNDFPFRSCDGFGSLLAMFRVDHVG